MAISLFKKKADKFDYDISRNCKVCDNIFKGRYCNVCGEKVTEQYERSMLNFLHSLLNAFTFLDGKFVKSIKLLIARPGELSSNISNGIRVPFMNMVSLFFVANFFYFFFPVFDSYNSSLHSQLNLQGAHSVRANEIVNEHLSKNKISMEYFEKEYNGQSTNLSKTLVVVLVIIFAALSGVINYSRERFLFDHILFSLEFYSFQILINLVILANAILYLIKLVASWGWDWLVLLSDGVFTIVAMALSLSWLIAAEMNFFKQQWYWAIPKGVLLMALMIESIKIYRMLLFYVTMKTL